MIVPLVIHVYYGPLNINESKGESYSYKRYHLARAWKKVCLFKVFYVLRASSILYIVFKKYSLRVFLKDFLLVLIFILCMRKRSCKTLGCVSFYAKREKVALLPFAILYQKGIYCSDAYSNSSTHCFFSSIFLYCSLIRWLTFVQSCVYR